MKTLFAKLKIYEMTLFIICILIAACGSNLSPCRGEVDSDDDGVCDAFDECMGDDASGDTDGDGLCDDTDNCVPIANPGQEDVEFPFGEGDVCNVVFVREGATGMGDGSTWADAFTRVQDAVVAAQGNLPMGPMKQIWIAAGTYRAASANGVVLTMVDELEVYGGFAGNETLFSERPEVLGESILDGDQAGNDISLDLATVNAEKAAPNQPTRSDNAAVVVELANDVILDGVVVSGGYTAVVQDGIGMLVPASTTGVEIRNVTARNNIGAVFNASGAGLSVRANSEISVVDSAFVSNIAWNGAGIDLHDTTATLENLRIEGNGSIGGQGAGIRQRGGDVTCQNTSISFNELSGNGGCGFLVLDGGTTVFTNVIFDGNIGRRGAIQAAGDRTFINVTIANHPTTGSEGAIWGDASVSFINAVFWNNAAGDLQDNGMNWPGSVIHTCSAMDLSTLGDDNIELDESTLALGDPFSVGDNGELFLAHTGAGDAFTSACVDAGDHVDGDPDIYFPAWSSLTTRSDGVLDGVSPDNIDLGFHYAP